MIGKGAEIFWHIWIFKFAQRNSNKNKIEILWKNACWEFTPLQPPVSRQKCRRENLTPLNFQTFRNENWIKSNWNSYEWQRGQDFQTYLSFQTFLNKFWIEIKLKISERLLFGNSPDYNQYPQLADKKYRQKIWHLWISKFSSTKFEYNQT